jgi:uncharacterized membrane-anchored protein YitT (DUF2179 family)
MKDCLDKLTLLLLVAGSAILAFGLCHIHAYADITEGGVLGMTLLFDHWLALSPALTGLIGNALCYLMGWRVLGGGFIVRSAVAGGGFSLFYFLFEQLPPLFPRIAEHPLAAAVFGAVFVGVGVGLCVRGGGAPSGDDALALSLSRLTGANIRWIYLISDLTVLGLSLTYIPLRRMVYSLLTVVLSGQIIGWIESIGGKAKEKPPASMD